MSLAVLMLFCSCGSNKPKVYMYTYNVQYVDFRHDEVKEMGTIDASGSISAFLSFPFKEQQEKARSLPEPTFPTITFRSNPDKAVLAIWSLEPDLYEVYVEDVGKKVTVETRDEAFIVKAIESFFSGSRAELYKLLSSQPGAVTARNFWSRFIFTFSGKKPNDQS